MNARRTSWPLFLSGWALVVSSGCVAFAQPAGEPKAEPKTATPAAADKPTAPADSSPAGKFNAVRTRYEAIDKQLSELVTAYVRETDPAKQATLKAEYTKLVGEIDKVLPELESAAAAAFAAEPNKDRDITRTLIGLVANHVRKDENEAALALAKTLADGKCEEPVLYAFAGTAAFRNDDYELAEKYLKIASDAGKLDRDARECWTELPDQKKAWAEEVAVREKEAKADDLPRVKLETSKGPIVIELFENEAPGAVGNFVNLVEKKYYDGLTFHRVLPNFMAQGGDPTGDGTGGPGYNIYCECEQPNARKHFRGTLSMAHAGKDTGGSQFFLTFRPTTHLNNRHTAFGRVVEGMDVLAKLQRRDPNAASPPQPDKIIKAEVLRKRDHAYEPKKVK
jgi:cyclophilin family peptidyl-prolyl cis-trans isomerase